MDDLRNDCPMRHENGNCTVIGGFCTAVNDPICEGLHSAYDSGYRAAALRAQQERENPKQITNADRIRAMSDEELAVWLCDLFSVDTCYTHCPGCDFCSNAGGLSNGLKKWLQQPAEEQND